MLDVGLSSSLRDAVDGAASIRIEAVTIRELLRKIVEQYPRMQSKFDEGVAVSVNGQIFRDSRAEPIPPDADVYLMPRIPGG